MDNDDVPLLPAVVPVHRPAEDLMLQAYVIGYFYSHR